MGNIESENQRFENAKQLTFSDGVIIHPNYLLEKERYLLEFGPFSLMLN